VVSAAVIAAQSGEISGEATVEGPADSLTSLVDRLAGQLLASQAGPGQPLSSLTTTSLPALRAFLSASSAFATGDHRVAADHYERALRFDSTFALAAFRLGLAARRMSDFALERKAIAQAWRSRETLNEQDRTHLTAWAGPQYPDASRRAESIAAWEAAARVAPDRADVWYEYAALLSNKGRELEALERERVLDALERAIELDPAYATPRLLLLRMTGRITPAAGADTIGNKQEGPPTPFLAWRLAQASSDSARLRALGDTLPNLGPVNLRMLAASAQFDGVRTDDGLRALHILSSRAQSLEQANDLLLAEHSLEVNRGQPSRAFTISRRMQRLSPATRSHLRLRVLDAVFAEGDTSVAREAAAELERLLQNTSSRSAGADACVLAQWKLTRDDTTAARRMLTMLREDDGQEPVMLSMPAPLCARLTETALAVRAGGADAQRRVLQLDSLVLTTAAVGDIAAFGHIAIARFHRRLGQPELSLEALRRRSYMSAAWPRYLASALREEGELAALVGDRAGAISAYERYLAQRPDPDATVKPQVDSVRAALRALEARQ
jgi:tetratricopeptide (TPR) repeat protein